MPVYEISFKFQHDCPFNNLSKKYPSVMFAAWCNYSSEFMEIKCNELELFNQLQLELRGWAETRGSRILHSSFDDKGGLILAMTCACDRRGSPTTVIEDNNCLQIDPTTYFEGWENYRIIGFDQESVSKLFNRLEKIGELEMVGRKPIRTGSLRHSFVISLTDLFSRLTEKQINALMQALEAGYYRLPKKVTTERIAEILNVPRTTFEEHMRKAESKVMSAVAPYISIYARSNVKKQS